MTPALHLGGEAVSFGDIVCYKGDHAAGAVMFIGPCAHGRSGEVDLLWILGTEFDCKVASFWQVCHHFDR